MELVCIKNGAQWDGASGDLPFTQSWQWGDVLIAEGKEVERLEVKEGEVVVALAQIVYVPLMFGWRYAFCPRGPVVAITNNQDTITKAIGELVKYFKNKNCIFFRVEPENELQVTSYKLQKSIDINPPATLILDLCKTEPELLAGMHPKTRYNIGLSERKGVVVREEKNFEIFWRLMRETAKRDGFKLHNGKHYEKVLESPIASQFIASYNGLDIACAVCVGYGKTFTYLYGASDYEHRNLMAPHLLQWKAICFAKEKGYKKYDFFGVAPPLLVEEGQGGGAYLYDPHHQYAGVTRFKLGFGGEPCQTAGTWDIIINREKYCLYNFLRKLRRLV